jgi:hypothetical protein
MPAVRSNPAPVPAQPGGAAAARPPALGEPELRALAERLLRLLREELRVERERRGPDTPRGH